MSRLFSFSPFLFWTYFSPGVLLLFLDNGALLVALNQIHLYKNLHWHQSMLVNYLCEKSYDELVSHTWFSPL